MIPGTLVLVRSHVRFARENLRWVGAGFLLMFFSSFGQTFFVGLSGNDLRAAFDLSEGQFGGLYTIATLASALTLPWMGRTLDLMPGWKVVRFSIPSLAIACVLVAVAPHVAVLTLALYLLRLFGQGMMTEIAFTEVGRWFSANRGRAMALVVPGVQAGAALLPVSVVLMNRLGGWRLTWWASAALLILVAYPAISRLLMAERVPKSAELEAGRPPTARDWTRREVIRDPVLYLLLAGTLAPPFIGTAIFFHQGHRHSRQHRVGDGDVFRARSGSHRCAHRHGRGSAYTDDVDDGLVRGRVIRHGRRLTHGACARATGVGRRAPYGEIEKRLDDDVLHERERWWRGR